MRKIDLKISDKLLQETLRGFLEKKGYVISNEADIILTHATNDSDEWVDVVKSNPCVYVLSEKKDVASAVLAMKSGACDYFVRPFLHDIILNSIERGNKITKPVPPQPKRELQPIEFIYKDSKLIKYMMREVDAISEHNLNVIIFGESGVGKEMVANMIHKKSGRNNFIAVDCGTLSRELAASELFGHVKGAFTGAIMDKVGAFEFAKGGTLFLDEIGNMPLDIQALLLRAIQEKKYKKVGDVKEVNMDIRLIVASNVDLHQAISKGTFREDLYHRLNEFSIKVPALRERGEDMMLYINHFIEKANVELNKSVSLSESSIEALINHTWSGNIRELMNVIRRAVLLCRNGVIDGIDDLLLKSENKISVTNEPLKDAANNAELDVIKEALVKTRYNKTEAAKLLNIDRKTLYNKMKLFTE